MGAANLPLYRLPGRGAVTMVLLLRADEVAPLLDLPKAIELTENALAEHGRGRTSTHAPFHLNVPGGALRVVSGALLDTGRMGLRSGPGWGLTPPSGNRTSVSLLYSTDGELMSIMGYPFASLRVGATVAVSVKHLAREDARRVGLIGTGNLSVPILEGVKAVRKISEVYVYSRDPERRRKFCDSASKELGIPVQPVDEAREAVTGMDIVLTATGSRQPLFPAEWLDKGTHVSSMGPVSETHADVFLKADRIIVTSIDHEENYFVRTPPFPLVELVGAGKLKWEDVSELGAVIERRSVGRKSTDDITVFHESQGGIGDMILVAWADEGARRRGYGQEVTF